MLKYTVLSFPELSGKAPLLTHTPESIGTWPRAADVSIVLLSIIRLSNATGLFLRPAMGHSRDNH